MKKHFFLKDKCKTIKAFCQFYIVLGEAVINVRCLPTLLSTSFLCQGLSVNQVITISPGITGHPLQDLPVSAPTRVLAL